MSGGRPEGDGLGFKEGGQALTVLNLDSAPNDAVLAEIKADKDIFDVQVAKL